MIKFHPSDNELAEYASGSADWAAGICITVHLHYCDHCKNRLQQLNSLGAACLTQSQAQGVSTPFSQLMTKIKNKDNPQGSTTTESLDTNQTNGDRASHVVKNESHSYPPVLQKLLEGNGNSDGSLNWKKVTSSLSASRLKTGQDKFEVSLHRIKRGGKVAEHDHGGREFTVVLEGSFSDESGVYSVGDFIAKNEGETHRPMATQESDCLCLSAVEAPVKLIGPLGWLVNPFLKVQPM